MKRKKNCTPDEHTSSIIIRSKLNLLTEPQNNSKQVALFILLLRVNSSFLVGEIFKRSCIICILKKTTRVGMKVSNYHFSCYYANLGQFYRDRIKFFLRLIGYFCAQLVCFCYYGFDFLSWFRLETKESSIKLHGNRKGSYHISGVNFQLSSK